MVISFNRFSCWLRRGKEEQSVPKSGYNYKSASYESGSGVKKSGSKKLQKIKETKIVPSERRVYGKWKKRERNRVDKEFDVVVVSSDDDESESDGSDYSVGWMEPHGPNFHSDEESDDSFAVLVPCYKHCGKKVDGSNNEIFSAFKNLPDEFSPGI